MDASGGIASRESMPNTRRELVLFMHRVRKAEQTAPTLIGAWPAEGLVRPGACLPQLGQAPNLQSWR